MRPFASASLGIAVIASLAMLSPGLAHAGAYNFTTIDNPADPAFNQLLGINDGGTIAGYFGSGAPGSPNQGYTVSASSPTVFTSENFPGSVQTQVTGINNTGTTVGFWSNTNTGTDANFGFVDQRGVFTNVNDPLVKSTPPVNQLLGVNDHNVAVGFYNGVNGNSHGYSYSIASGVFTPVTISGATSLTASAINNSGEIAGFYTQNGLTQGFLDKNGAFTNVNPSGTSNTMLFGLNNNGLAVGVTTINGVTDGLLYNTNTDTYQLLNDPNGVGTTVINGLNSAGDLVGFYVDGTGNTNGFLATPVPEPGSLALLGAGLVALLLVRRRMPGQ